MRCPQVRAGGLAQANGAVNRPDHRGRVTLPAGPPASEDKPMDAPAAMREAFRITGLALGRGPAYPEAREALDAVNPRDLRTLLAVFAGVCAQLTELAARRAQVDPRDLLRKMHDWTAEEG